MLAARPPGEKSESRALSLAGARRYLLLVANFALLINLDAKR